MQKLKWGILATGNIAHKFASDLRFVKNAELVAVASRNKEKSIGFANQFGIKHAFGSYEELALSKEVDVIYIATPHAMHYENTLMCLNNGKHVLCEKPAAMNSHQLMEMINLAQDKNLFFMEAFWTRFLPSYQKFREIALDGSIGKIHSIQADFGFIASKDPMHRLQNKDLGGGALLDVGVYPVFLSLDIAGKPDEIVSKSTINVAGVDEFTSVLFKYSEKQIVSNLHSSIVATLPVVATIYGSEGNVTLERMWHAPAKVSFVKTGKKPKSYKFKKRGFGYEHEALEVTNCILNGKNSSDVFSPQSSILIHNALDEIRKQIGLKYNSD